MDKVINSLAKKLSENLVRNNKIGIEKQELYRYGALIAIQSSLNIFTTLFLGLIFGKFWENICFFIAFKILREYSGGLHSSKFSTCYFISTISNLAILLAIKYFEVYPNYYLAIIIEIVSFLVIVVFAPVVNLNKPITRSEHRIYKLIVCGVSVILIGISILLYLNEFHKFSNAT